MSHDVAILPAGQDISPERVGHGDSTSEADQNEMEKENIPINATSTSSTRMYWLIGGAICCCTCCCCLGGGAVVIVLAFAVKAHVLSDGAPFDCSDLPVLEGHPEIVTHKVVTRDGITLGFWRLPQNDTQKLRPVLIMHGLECSARDWFAGLDSQALPWQLWRAGFDVWLGNNRGNFLTETPQYDWTFEEMADIDLPTMVNEVLAVTGAASLAYVGHSQGALQAFMHFTADNVTSAKISHFAALAPAVYMTQQRWTWNALSGFHIDEAWSYVGEDNSFKTAEEAQRDKCYTVSMVGGCWTCSQDMGGSFMAGEKGFAPSCQTKFRCIPAGTSTNNVRAFAMALRAGDFQGYLTDRGRPINFTAMTVPVSLAVGDKDLFMSPDNVKRIGDACPPEIVTDFTVVEGAGHMDLVWGTKTATQVFEPLVQRLLSI
eukprot:TRINITY_DN75808_c0_g1_i1.p1 TRINITY_DN75808_c0_g1~~TRINITY_DN75808_c0_g1_i1.p1  ORF type:complete len:431 (+),score=64.84 TRINITY_DN75808_c0_g1_i1:117-1409(+)